VQLKNTVDWIHAHVSEWCLPLLVIHGTGDSLVSPEGSRRFVHGITFSDVEFREYEGGYHELFNDIIRDQVLIDVKNWLGSHL
jgi:alpha-beta hydrolase superfamily lysophospholipase